MALVSAEHILRGLNPEGTLTMGSFTALSASPRGLWMTAGLPLPEPQGESKNSSSILQVKEPTELYIPRPCLESAVSFSL